MKRILAVMLVLILLSAGCSVGNDTSDASEEAANPLGYQSLEFYYSSGVGGWSTQLTLQPDGSFTGHYEDTDLGDRGEEYPGGTVYCCDFSGSFSQPAKVDDYRWTMVLEYLSAEKEPGETTYADGVRYVSAPPNGLERVQEVWLYLPGARTEDLPQGFLSWTTSAFAGEVPEELPFYGLYNVNEETGFVGYSWEETPGQSG